MSILLFHPSVANFVQQVARSLHEVDELDRFITTVYDQPDSLRQRAACAAGRLVRRDLAAQFRRRAITEIPVSKVEPHPWGELLRLASGALDRSGRLTDLVWERTETAFDRLVSRRLSRKLHAVYGYEFCSLATFTRARELGLRTIYDLPAPEPNFVHGLLEVEMQNFPELRTPYHHHIAPREKRRTERRRAEWHAADLVLVNSHFTRNSYARAGLDCTKVRVATLGAPPVIARDAALAGPATTGQLTLLWAGTFSIRKGAHYALEAWRRGRLGYHARLLVFGAVGLPDRVLHPLPPGVELRGSIPRSELLEHYRHADALLFPTLCDGFGLVVTEAWSRGLPVITTDRAGAADLLKPGINGRLIRAADADAIIAEVEWCATHRPELAAMREASHASARNWQWSDYRLLHASFLREAGMFTSGRAALA